MADHLHVITGGPGSGKTSLIDALAAEGVHHMPEAGRAIIQDQVDIGGKALPWDDREAFAMLMLAWEMRSHCEAGVGSGQGRNDTARTLDDCNEPRSNVTEIAA